MEWTEDRVKVLTSLWGQGVSASEIAQKLGGVTRNAVIGKAFRMGLSSRPSPIRRKLVVEKTAPPALKSLAPMVSSNAAETIRLPLISPPAVPLSDRHQCKWPMGDPKKLDFAFCCRPCQQGVPYCPDHAALAYQANSKRKLEDDKRLLSAY